MVSKTLYEVHWSKTRYMVSNNPIIIKSKIHTTPYMKSKDPIPSNTKLRLQLKTTFKQQQSYT